jgi:hypothetical protein
MGQHIKQGCEDRFKDNIHPGGWCSVEEKQNCYRHRYRCAKSMTDRAVVRSRLRSDMKVNRLYEWRGKSQ